MQTATSLPDHHVELNSRGFLCPMPLIQTKLAMNKMAVGEVLKVEATDAGTRNDFATHCRFAGHEVIHTVEDQGVITFWIRKGRR